ncbi:hypothetical protein UFOVP328_267 [uncultured Caudovirales phage]|uniref:Uncharacterized protein n=1 Tax=uncultured Caudovirales phage TaxID=2100421 RepID=A0A6J5LU19_9CAUD|nr:hypothetical protein UFOVP328_267 [uncultured Caudovirales phage]
MTKTKSSTIKLLNPKSPETKYTGGEPEWRVQPDAERRVSALSAAFSWYNYHYGKKDAKDMIVHWLEHNERSKDAKKIRGIPDSQIRLTPAWVCRMNLVGLELNEHELLQINDQISQMLRVKDEVKVVVTEEETAQNRVTIQDRLREKVSECAGELEGVFDEFLADGAKMSASIKPISTIRGMNVAPQMISNISDIWKKRQAELEEVVEGKDGDLVEGYSNFSKIQLRNMIKFCEAVINDCGAYVQIKKVERKPRAKKVQSPEAQARKFKYLKAFEELKLESEPPARLVGAGEAWLYDTKKRKLIYVVADTHIGEISVKNNMILGFDAAASVQKTLRKPADQIKALLAGGKPAARKYFKDIKATDTKFNGRGTENLIILRAGK